MLCKNCQQPSEKPLCEKCVRERPNYYPFDRCPFCKGPLLTPDWFVFICVDCFEEFSHINL
ncbi:MAG: hypothetical protein HPY50_07690 [Firmicutes bacterium]|nr:hypothetical protein [Bacillota bacterium]